MKQRKSLGHFPHLRPRSEGFTLVELLVVIAIIGTLAALFSGNILSALRKGDEVTCTNHLKNIGTAAIAFALDERFFPVAKGKNPPAYESLNVLINSEAGADLSPSDFICPASMEAGLPAEQDENGKFILDEDTCSYAWLGQRTKSTTSTSTALGSDDSIADKDNGVEENHEGFVMVVYAGGDVKKVKADELPEGRILPKRLVDQSGE